MTNVLKPIRENLLRLYFKYPYLKNKNYNYVYFKYCEEFHYEEIQINKPNSIIYMANFWEKMPAMESISRARRKLALDHPDMFSPNDKNVIEARLNQTNNIIESVRD